MKAISMALNLQQENTNKQTTAPVYTTTNACQYEAEAAPTKPRDDFAL